MTKTKLCPKCLGVGLIETRIGGHYCRECGGRGRIPKPDPIGRTEEVAQQAPAKGEPGVVPGGSL